jgi:hypothetical protein
MSRWRCIVELGATTASMPSDWEQVRKFDNSCVWWPSWDGVHASNTFNNKAIICLDGRMALAAPLMVVYVSIYLYVTFESMSGRAHVCLIREYLKNICTYSKNTYIFSKNSWRICLSSPSNRTHLFVRHSVSNILTSMSVRKKIMLPLISWTLELDFWNIMIYIPFQRAFMCQWCNRHGKV